MDGQTDGWTDRTIHKAALSQLKHSPTAGSHCKINTLKPRQNGHHFPDDTFKHIFLNENVRIEIEISLKFVPKGPISNIPALV